MTTRDTNAVVALLYNEPSGVRERHRQARAAGDSMSLSSVVLFELWYRVAKSGDVRENTERLRVLLSGDLDLLSFDDEDARTRGPGAWCLGEGRHPDRRL
jgi:tRNA(fMet)-specific endonuclease VapC